MSFVSDDFLLQSESASVLYHQYAAPQPVADFHTQLAPGDVAADRHWENLEELWLRSDPLKWRALRAHGVPESAITGALGSKDKFLVWAEAVPHLLRNPLYHWTHLELVRCFGIEELLSLKTAESIWRRANEQIASPDFSAHALLRQFNVRTLAVPEDPCDRLSHYPGEAPAILSPLFQPDAAMNLLDLRGWNTWTDRLSHVSGSDLLSLGRFMAALESRHRHFHEHGARSSAHVLSSCPYAPATPEELEDIYDAARSGRTVSARQAEQFATYILQQVAAWNAGRGWVMQLHLGALSTGLESLPSGGRPAPNEDGAIHDVPVISSLNALLHSLNRNNTLPKTLLFNANPAKAHAFASLATHVRNGEIAGKVQFGIGSTALEDLQALNGQINALSSYTLLSHFIGLTSGSTGFLSFVRHEYFRRLFCNCLGKEMETGLIPRDFDLVGNLVTRVSFQNAHDFFGVEA